jgi:hypothetical protein
VIKTLADAELDGWKVGSVAPVKSLFEATLRSQSAKKRLANGSTVTAHAKSRDESELPRLLLEQILEVEERIARRGNRPVRVRVRS